MAVLGCGKAKEALRAARDTVEDEAAKVKLWQRLAKKRALLDARRACVVAGAFPPSDASAPCP